MSPPARWPRGEPPHGAVSYHFRARQELLTEAALYAFRHAIPVDRVEALETVDDLLALIAGA